MYKRKSKSDLMFLLTVFVCLGVLVTTTVNAAEPEQQGWAMTVSAQTDCPETIGAWQNCAHWQGIGTTEKSAIQQATVHFFHEARPNLGVFWYYSQDNSKNTNNINGILSRNVEYEANFEQRSSGQFGVALRQQYRHFGFSVGIESEQALPLNNDATLFVGVSNRW